MTPIKENLSLSLSIFIGIETQNMKNWPFFHSWKKAGSRDPGSYDEKLGKILKIWKNTQKIRKNTKKSEKYPGKLEKNTPQNQDPIIKITFSNYGWI